MRRCHRIARNLLRTPYRQTATTLTPLSVHHDQGRHNVHCSYHSSSQAQADASLLHWSEQGSDDVDDQVRLFDVHRQAFSMALQTISAMTPQPFPDVHDTQDKVDWNSPLVGDPSTDAQYSEIVTKRQGFYRRLHQLTAKDQFSQKGNSLCLKQLFEDPIYSTEKTIHSYTIAIAYCVRSNNFKLLRHFAVDAQRSGIAFNTQFCNLMLGLFVNDRSLNSWCEMLNLFASMGIKANTSTWNQLLTLATTPQKLIVLEYMKNLHVPQDAVTHGILMPLQTHHAPVSAMEFRAEDYADWSSTKGDVYIGDLLQRRELRSAIFLLSKLPYPATLDGYNQVFSTMRKLPKGKVKWHKTLQELCQSMHKRGLRPDSRTFLLLFQLGDFVTSTGYREMIFTRARSQDAVSAPLWQARHEQQVTEQARIARRTQLPRVWDWDDWLRPAEASGSDT